MTNQYALGYKSGLEAAVKVCLLEAEFLRNDEDGSSFTLRDIAKQIAALPVPEVQWLDLTDDEIEEAVNSSDGDDLMKDIRAVIAKFKEKQHISRSKINAAAIESGVDNE